MKKLLKAISYSCVVCQKAYAQTAAQMMGQLPADRVQRVPPFSVVGLDFAWSFLYKRSNPRKPTMVKAYVCIFVCFVTKAVHIELSSDLTSEAFLASFYRYSSRRGYPRKVHSENGTNFTGAQRELEKIHQLLQADETRNKIHHYASQHHIDMELLSQQSTTLWWSLGSRCEINEDFTEEDCGLSPGHSCLWTPLPLMEPQPSLQGTSSSVVRCGHHLLGWTLSLRNLPSGGGTW